MKIMISETKMVHKLWAIMEERSYQVDGEVKVVLNEKYYEIWDSKPEVEKRQPYIVDDSIGSLKFKKKGGVSTTIDLVATDGEKFIGFEIKDGFEAVGACIHKGQLDHYIEGGLLDEIYLVIPSHECEHVKSSYGNHLKEIGAGLTTLDENYNLTNVFPSSTFYRSTQPDLKENEAWLKQKLWNYFELQFDVEGEGILPKSLKEMKKLSGKAPSPKRFFKRIDLFLLTKNSSITEVAYNQDKLECIGIEVKYEIKTKKELEGIISQQLNPYAESGALTRLYLATSIVSNALIEEMEKVRNRKFGFLLYNEGNVKTILEPPKLQMQYDMFAYMPPSGEGVTVYEFGKPNPIKTIDFPYHNYKDIEKIFRGKLKFYRVIYAGLSCRGVSHAIKVIPKENDTT